MGKDSLKRGWNWLLRWVLWWRIDTRELKYQVEGYETLGVITSARGFSLVVAILAGVGKGIILCLFITHKLNAIGMAYILLMTAESLLFLVLGYMAYRGKPKATAALMALWTADITMLSVSYFYYHWVGWDFYFQPVATSIPLVEMLLGWAYCMHPFALARRVQWERTREA